ncbi:DUF4145 domain-containing protein [Vagococcus sp. DIV0080]|uniref:DUF4145 domain-containing protein n=1 Tax=Candidatus Vagococcus giribetii TaxID=2230876 RepID=A0ABS3HXM3_9ENTE|nr:DUF4145 domain-containing protein [Vagococcus sp. DIV0080]MBO0477947.1 DUF4145 domain-containing protein [Vagococcus sp. DIV0080]
MIERSLRFYDLENDRTESTTIKIDEPRQCRHCKNTGTQVFLEGVGTLGKLDESRGICIFACKLCGSSTVHFMTLGQRVFPGDFDQTNFLTPYDSVPSKSISTDELPEDIKTRYPEFTNIYKQSQKAEENGLNQIAGMGYRKALEFLVTDFLIEHTPEGTTEEWLRNPKTMLGSKIDRLRNERLKKLAKASSFIGNDETHYTRKHTEHDVNSIKMFIKALLSDVENEIILIEAETLLNKPK